MRDYIDVGPVPYEEECQQVGMPSYNATMAKCECREYKRMLEKKYPDVHFGLKTFPHDFGSYTEVVAYYDPNNEDEANKAFEAEAGIDYWDDEAKLNLGLVKYEG